MNQPKTQPTKPSQPSAGALRAAEHIKKLYMDAFTTRYIAVIIDRETGVAELLQQVANLQRTNDEQARKLAELLEAAKEAVRQAQEYAEIGRNVPTFGIGNPFESLEQAISKCKGGE